MCVLNLIVKVATCADTIVYFDNIESWL